MVRYWQQLGVSRHSTFTVLYCRGGSLCAVISANPCHPSKTYYSRQLYVIPLYFLALLLRLYMRFTCKRSLTSWWILARNIIVRISQHWILNPFSSGTRFYIYCTYYMTILYSFRNSWGVKMIQTQGSFYHRFLSMWLFFRHISTFFYLFLLFILHFQP